MTSHESAGKAKILLVDDIELNCILTGAVLERAGFDIESVYSGRAALASIETRSFDLILLDLDMPDLDGHAAARLIQQRENGRTRLAALSMRADDTARDRSREVGLQDHICRPLKPDELVRKVEEILAQKTGADPDDPWDRAVYKDFAARLGVERMQGFLNRLLDRFAALLALLDDEAAADEPHRVAHDVASVGGMLGFAGVTQACRDLMAARDTPGETDARAALRQVLEAAHSRLAIHLATVAPLAA